MNIEGFEALRRLDSPPVGAVQRELCPPMAESLSPLAMSAEERIFSFLTRSLASDPASQRVQAKEAIRIQTSARRKAAARQAAALRAERERELTRAEARRKASEAIRQEIMEENMRQLKQAEHEIMQARVAAAERAEAARLAREQARASDGALIEEARRSAERALKEQDIVASKVEEAQRALEQSRAAAGVAEEALHRTSMRRAEARSRRQAAVKTAESARAARLHDQGVLARAKHEHQELRMQLRPAEIKFAEEEAKRGAASRAAELAVSRKALAERQRQLGDCLLYTSPSPRD